MEKTGIHKYSDASKKQDLEVVSIS